MHGYERSKKSRDACALIGHRVVHQIWLRPNHFRTRMIPWRSHCIFTIPLLSILLRTTNGAQFSMHAPTGYGTSKSTFDKSALKSHFSSLYEPETVNEELYTWIPLTEAEIPELSALSDQHFTRVSLPMFPEHSVRIKKTKDWCDPSVNSYTGYIDVGAKHLFFYFFESRSPSDDLILWTNGGPGCSSSLGLFMELGPCQIRTVADISNPPVNPYSWNNNASMIFIDQPVGVGFSYADYGVHVGTTEAAAKDIAAFVAIFMQHFINKKEGTEKLKFHLAGESYGGRYIPVFAGEIMDFNMILKKSGSKLRPIPLKSVMIGNGLTDFSTMMTSYYDMSCTNTSIEPFLPISKCTRMRKAIPRCEALIKIECVDRYDTMSCWAAASSCALELEEPFWSSGLNPYDISKQCDGPIEDTLCYPQTEFISTYLNLLKTRKALGIDGKVTEYVGCAESVGVDFESHLDMWRVTTPYVEALLERGVKVLIYVGKNDWICNHVGNYRWTEALQWSGHKAFSSQEMREWTVDGNAAGETRSANGLTFATIYDAGHMVPFDKPKQSLAMVNRWLANQDL